MSKVWVILPEGFEEIETVTPVDLLRRAQIEVVLIAEGESLAVRGRCGMTLTADRTLAEMAGQPRPDLLMLPGGPGVSKLRRNPAVVALVRAQAASDGWLAAICAAPLVLKDADVLPGPAFTAHYSTHEELPDAQGNKRVVQSGKLITSRGAGTALDFGLKLVAAIVGDAARDEIATAIMA